MTNAIQPTLRNCRWCGEPFEAKGTDGQLCLRHRNDERLKGMFARGRVGIGRTSEWERELSTASTFCAFDIFERDQWICWICGDAIDPDCRFPDPLSGAIDHVVPLPVGENTPENCRSSHLRCNGTRKRKEAGLTNDVRYLGAECIGLDVPTGQIGDEYLLESASNSIRREGVRRAMQALPDIERRILELRFGFEGEPWTLMELVEEFDLSRERIRQLEGQALCRLGVLRDLVGCYHAQISRRVKASEGA